MRNIIGNIIIALGVILSIYIGGYLMLYGGIIQIIDNINPTNGGGIALGIIRIIFCELGFYIPFIFSYYLGLIIKFN